MSYDPPSPIDSLWDATNSITVRLDDIIALLRQLLAAAETP